MTLPLPPSAAPVPLMLLHGLFGQAGNWAAAARHYAGRHQVLVPELPLFRTPSGDHAIEWLCTCAIRHMDELGIERAVVAGNSLGGHVALRMALAHPHRVQALILAGSSGLFERGFERKVPRRPSHEYLREKIGEVFFDPSHVTEELMTSVRSSLADPRKVLSILRLAKNAKRDNLADQLPRLRCPTLLVWGENDSITPPAVAHEFNDLIDGSQLHFIPRCGHAPMMERPGEFMSIMDDFLSRISVRSCKDAPREAGRTQS